MLDGKLLIEKLISYGKAFLYLNKLDEIYIRNTLLQEFKLSSPIDNAPNLDFIKEMTVPDVLFNEIKDYARERSIAEDDTRAELFASYIMGILTPKPSEINQNFKTLKERMGAQASCDFLYNISVMNGYIKKTAISKNIMWTAVDGDNTLEITINLSKPEKDNKDIAKMVNAPKTGYPLCALCKENEGYFGDYNHPPRANLRTVSVTLGGQLWYMQYSPYAYFSEHCIVFNGEHTPMIMKRETLEKLLDFIEMFPNYFIGSNSDLPIVGGSILNHEHYQGGKHLMPMHKSKVLYPLEAEGYKDVEVGILNWYNSAVRLTGYNRKSVAALAGDIIEAWKCYSAPEAGIINSAEERHNTVTPIARFTEDKKYCVELILRNNYQSQEYPDGVFHAHPEYHNIKKEGIGLIEAMGLYILPGRLKRETEEIAKILTKETFYEPEEIAKTDNPLYIHRNMISELVSANSYVKTEEAARKIIGDYINNVCVKILDNTAVFKKDDEGAMAFKKFLSTLSVR